MRKRMTFVILGLCTLLLSGCEFLHREYSVVKPHSSTYYESENSDALRAEGYQDLVNDLLVLIDQHAQRGTIRLYTDAEGLDAADAMEQAVVETQYETPLGAYGVDYITYTLGEEKIGVSVLQVEFGYRRTAEQMNALIHTTSVSALYDLLIAAVNNDTSELAVQVSYFRNRQEVEDIIAQVRQEQGVNEPWQVNFYPKPEDAGIIELFFDVPEEAGQELLDETQEPEQTNP